MEPHEILRKKSSCGRTELPEGSPIYILAAIIFCLCSMVLLAWGRAGWLDEYWTVWHSDPSLPLGQAYRSHWIQDAAHPPTFYAFAWAIGHLTVPTLVVRRLADNSLALLLFAAPTAVLCWQHPSARVWLTLFALAMISGPFAIVYFAEHRSYFACLSAAASLIATVRQLHCNSLTIGATDRGLTIWFVGLTVVALNIHYTATLALLVFLGCVCIYHIFAGRRATALLIAGTMLIALVPLLVTFGFAARLHKVPVVVHIGLVQGWAIILAMAAMGPIANPVLFLTAVRGTSPHRSTSQASNSFVAILSASLIMSIVVFAGVHAATHNIVPRLLLTFIPITTALTIELAMRGAPDRRVILWASVVAGCVDAATLAAALCKPRWEYSAPMIASQVDACPNARVVAINPMTLLPARDDKWRMTGQYEAMALSYHLIAKKWGFNVHVVPNDGPVPPARRCPTLVWLEHNFFRSDLSSIDLLRLARLPPSVKGGTMARYRAGAHDLLMIAP